MRGEIQSGPAVEPSTFPEAMEYLARWAKWDCRARMIGGFVVAEIRAKEAEIAEHCLNASNERHRANAAEDEIARLKSDASFLSEGFRRYGVKFKDAINRLKRTGS